MNETIKFWVTLCVHSALVMSAAAAANNLTGQRMAAHLVVCCLVALTISGPLLSSFWRKL